MIDYCLKFPDEATAMLALFDNERARYDAVDVIGVIYKPTGKMLKSDEGPVPEMKPVPGWHVNVRHSKKIAELSQYQIFPQTPERVWF